MNRYRTMPGQGPSKATAATTCQKCLKKDSYECKAGATERPYISRPSRTQQLLNPKLKPRLTYDTPNELLKREGIADEQLARTQLEREIASRRRSRSPEQISAGSERRNSISAISDDSVSTISTNRSRSRSPKYGQDQQHNLERSTVHNAEQGHAKRKHRDISTSGSRSPSHKDRDTIHKNRRYGSTSPRSRGRPESHRRGSHRDRSQSNSYDRSETTKHRVTLDSCEEKRANVENHKMPSARYGHDPAFKSRDRSLSPFSKRLALTQAMNMAR